MLVKYDLGGKRQTGDVVKENDKTVWISIKDKKTGKPTTIKRHKEKHHVEKI